ncbi:MAG: sigma-70 family RNA polymerase sigma factor [Caldilineaceae bacterium]
MTQQPTPLLVDHLFRQEAGKMIAYLTRIFGFDQLELAEDVVQDTLSRALELWPSQGVPDNPSAWLMRVARNRAIDLVRREKKFQHLVPELLHRLRVDEAAVEASATFTKEIQDDQLRMMFACCHPDLSLPAQVTLILKTLCGFSVFEIAHTLFTSEDAVEKRLVRARKFFRQLGSYVEITQSAEIPARLETIYRAIYLLFNEGYHGSQAKETVREELCFEAIRLTVLLSEHPAGARPQTYALLALFCFHAARLSTRINDESELIQLKAQDRSRWDPALLAEGFHFLEQAAEGNELSEYHLEAGIAALHCAAPTYAQTDWHKILELYTLLYRLKLSPIIALNRAIALGNALGAEAGLTELKQIPNRDKLKEYPFYPAACGEFHLRAGEPTEALKYFAIARQLARSSTESEFFERKCRECRGLSQTSSEALPQTDKL